MTKFKLSDPSGTQNNEKFGCQQHHVAGTLLRTQMMVCFFVIDLSPTNHLSPAMDRSRSQLLRPFFLASWRFLWRPKRPHCISPNFVIFPMFLMIPGISGLDDHGGLWFVRYPACYQKLYYDPRPIKTSEIKMSFPHDRWYFNPMWAIDKSEHMCENPRRAL